MIKYIFKDPGLSEKEGYNEQWKILIGKCTDALDRLIEMASSRRRNYILDQVYISLYLFIHLY